MTIELVLVLCAFLFAVFSFFVVFAASVVAESKSTADLPSGLGRRSANFDLERVAEPKHADETWFNFLWVRAWRIVAAYVRCKSRTMPGRLDLLVVGMFLAAAAIGWLDIIAMVLEFLFEYFGRA